MVRRSIAPPEPIDIQALAEKGSQVARKHVLKGKRREDLYIAPERIEALRLVLEKEGGYFSWPLSFAIEFLGLRPSYNQPQKAGLMASSLSRRLSPQGIRVGAHDKGESLTFRFRRERRTSGRTR